MSAPRATLEFVEIISATDVKAAFLPPLVYFPSKRRRT